jgi:hypothetical protein
MAHERSMHNSMYMNIGIENEEDNIWTYRQQPESPVTDGGYSLRHFFFRHHGTPWGKNMHNSLAS